MKTSMATALAAGWIAVVAGTENGTVATATGTETSGAPPNFVVVYMDDMGYGDPGCYGAKGWTTPNLDRMAREGIRLTDYHAAQGVCSASRASLMTGCYPNRVGILGALGPLSKIGLDPAEDTIADVLKRRGYACGIFGKWHLGDAPQFLPLRQGFDEYFGLPYSNDMWPVNYDGRPLDQVPQDFKPRRRDYVPLFLIENDRRADPIRTLEDQNTLTTRYTERAVAFVERHRDGPFFLYLPHSMPHVPLGVSAKFRGKSAQGMYGDVMMEIDWSVGRILDALKRCGIDDRTMVIFASDNGPWLNFGNHAGTAGPLREGKGTSWEGGICVPFIARWPGRIPAGTECRRLAASIDVLPTLAALAGAPLPERRIDGVSLVPLLEGEPKADPRTSMYCYWGRALEAVREGKWKLHFPHAYRSIENATPGRDGIPGDYGQARTELALYDLEADVGEKINVADRHPDIVARLKALADRARADLGDGTRSGPGCRSPGQVD